MAARGRVATSPGGSIVSALHARTGSSAGGRTEQVGKKTAGVDGFRKRLLEERRAAAERGRPPRRRAPRVAGGRAREIGTAPTTTSATSRPRPSTASSTKASRRAPSRCSRRSTPRSRESRPAPSASASVCGKPIGEERLRGDRRGRPSASTTSGRQERGDRASSGARRRSGRLGDGRAARRSRWPSARSRRGSSQWRARCCRRRRGAADQVTKHVVTSQLGSTTESQVVGPLSIHHVQNSGIAFGLFSRRRRS